MRELQDVYEAILGQKLRRTSFQRRMLSTGLLVRREKKFSGAAHKAPYLYSFTKSPGNKLQVVGNKSQVSSRKSQGVKAKAKSRKPDTLLPHVTRRK